MSYLVSMLIKHVDLINVRLLFVLEALLWRVIRCVSGESDQFDAADGGRSCLLDVTTFNYQPPRLPVPAGHWTR